MENITFYCLSDMQCRFPLATKNDMIERSEEYFGRSKMIESHWGDVHNGELDTQYYRFDARPMFVAFSHNLTASQIEDAVKTLNINQVINLGDVRADLQKALSQIPPNWELAQIKKLAAEIVAVAVEHKAEVFFCTGEPTLTLWANNIASGLVCYDSDRYPSVITYQGNYNGWFKVDGKTFNSDIRCVQSTSERKSVEVTNPDGTVTKTQIFSHVMWRNMF